MGSHTNNARSLRVSDDSAISDSQRVLDGIRRIVQYLRVSSRAAEREMGLSAAQLFVLQKLGDASGISLNELAARTLTHQSSVSVVVQKLVERKLIHRKPSERDGRAMVITLTPAGRRLVHKSPQAAQDRLIQAIEAMPRRKRAQLAQLLEHLAAGTSGKPVRPSMFFEDSHSRGKAHAP